MRAPTIDRDDPDARAQLAVGNFERRERATRIAKALGLFALAVLGPWLTGPVPGEPATVGAVIASLLFLGGGAAIWPWTWSDAEHKHHTAAAIWAQIQPTARRHGVLAGAAPRRRRRLTPSAKAERRRRRARGAQARLLTRPGQQPDRPFWPPQGRLVRAVHGLSARPGFRFDAAGALSD